MSTVDLRLSVSLEAITAAVASLGAEVAAAEQAVTTAIAERDQALELQAQAETERNRCLDLTLAANRERDAALAEAVTATEERNLAQAAAAEAQARAAAAEAAVAALTAERDRLRAELDALKPAPTVPSITVTLTITGAPPETFTLSAEHACTPFRDTKRYEMPLKEGLWLVVHDTPKHAKTDYIVERHNPAVYGAGLTPVGYTIEVVDTRGTPQFAVVAAHSQGQRYRLQSSPWPTAPINPRHFFRVSPRCNPQGIPATGEVTPLFDGGLARSMGNSGLRADIGPYTGWLARGLRTGDYAAARRNAEASGSIPWHVRDADGNIVMLSGPEHLARQMQTWYGTHSSLDDTIRTYFDSWKPDTAHAAKSAWTGYALNSDDPDPYFIEELQFKAAAVISQAARSYTRSSSGLLITREQVRDFAWGMVDMVQAFVATPEDAPDWLLPRSRFAEIIDANMEVALSLVGKPGFDRVSVALGKYSPSKTAGALSYQSNVADYIPYAMAHCFRLTGDERFIRLGRAHLDGRVAKRWKASPKYAALYPPVAVGTGTGYRYFNSWDEAYAAKGWTSKPGDETGGWLRPTGLERGADGKLLMPYTSDEMIGHTLLVAQLYQAMGFSTPDIDWLAGYLEQRSAGGGCTMWEQFAPLL